jgi:hypothetical protein
MGELMDSFRRGGDLLALGTNTNALDFLLVHFQA